MVCCINPDFALTESRDFSLHHAVYPLFPRPSRRSLSLTSLLSQLLLQLDCVP